ncbi:unnamed protein product [Staurois parvus]|uniref:G-protein coupled receptors family 1 profile domain-containing protein n=1 Tax=Staurois parvus TaxID=386267 RepID=A0ABN9BJL4_9NEOB|nr:unnamed protein product [Staurois parvus]
MGLPFPQQKETPSSDLYGQLGSGRFAVCHLDSAQDFLSPEWQQLDLWGRPMQSTCGIFLWEHVLLNPVHHLSERPAVLGHCKSHFTHPVKKTKIALIVSATIWVVIILSTVPLYLVEQTVYVNNVNITTCHDVLPLSVLASDMFNYFLSLAIGLFFFPAILTIVAYVLMIRTLNASITDENIGKKRRKAIVLIITVLVMCVVCFMPSNILLLVNYATIKETHVGNIYAFYIVALCLSALNSCIDPFVYYFVSKDFRDHV